MIRVKNWERFQHFSNRRPPWIKLYRELLDDPEWHQVDIKLIRHLVNIWLIASDDKNLAGILPGNEKLAFRLRVSMKELENSILPGLSDWLIFDDISVISTCHQNDTTETETEIEIERVPRPKNGRFTPPTLDEVSEYCKGRNSPVDPFKFHAHYTANGWKVGKNPMKNWRASVCYWERNSV